jgi:hypothetical protein
MAALRPWMQGRTHHEIRSLYSAQALTSRPDHIPHPRLRGVKAQGQRYEKLVGKKLLSPIARQTNHELRSSTWFEFVDGSGRGHCEVDYLLFTPTSIYVFEVKLTQTPRGLSQLQELYLPVVRKVFSLVPVYGVMICKTLWTEPANLATSWEEVQAHVYQEELLTWHWLGR